MLKKIWKILKADYTPKSIEILRKGYSLSLFRRDCISGLTVSIVSLPLAMALAIASGLTPAQGLYTAIVAGFVIALTGGSRFQIGGPTGAFAIVVLDVLQNYGYNGLVAAMILTGFLLIIAGFLKLGSYIKYIPYPVIIGFTAGIGLILITSQVKEFLGLTRDDIPNDFIQRWYTYVVSIPQANWAAAFIGVLSLTLYVGIKKFTPKIPVYLAILVITTVVTCVFELPVETIGSKYGNLPKMLPVPSFPTLSLDLFRLVFPSALTVAFLAAVESLLSAKVVDSMSGDMHNSNAELIGEGLANIAAAAFLGLPATGAIARTATNYKANAYSPVSGMMQSVFLLIFMFCLSPLVKYIPLSSLALILIMIGWNMLNLDKMYGLIKLLPGDRYTLLVTVILTVVVNLSAAIAVGFIMSAVIFMHRMSKEIELANMETMVPDVGVEVAQELRDKGIVVVRVAGPLFFGVVTQISEFFRQLENKPNVVIIRMGHVSMIDASGANLIVEFIGKMHKTQTKVIISNIKTQPKRVLHQAFANAHVRLSDISTASNYDNAVKMAKRYVNRKIKEKAVKEAAAAADAAV
ncbi:MAG: SulP family inorganic anion transporter [Pseudomonadota bacterium]|nr:SulP family inorganic anion transporter [Pseudomonadota bacterium]